MVSIYVAKGCPTIPSPPSGRFISSNGGAVLRLECNPGYIPSSSPMIYCVDRFDWNGTAPLCQGFISFHFIHNIFPLAKHLCLLSLTRDGFGRLSAYCCAKDEVDRSSRRFFCRRLLFPCVNWIKRNRIYGTRHI